MLHSFVWIYFVHEISWIFMIIKNNESRVTLHDNLLLYRTRFILVWEVIVIIINLLQYCQGRNRWNNEGTVIPRILESIQCSRYFLLKNRSGSSTDVGPVWSWPWSWMTVFTRVVKFQTLTVYIVLFETFSTYITDDAE